MRFRIDIVQPVAVASRAGVGASDELLSLLFSTGVGGVADATMVGDVSVGVVGMRAVRAAGVEADVDWVSDDNPRSFWPMLGTSRGVGVQY